MVLDREIRSRQIRFVEQNLTRDRCIIAFIEPPVMMRILDLSRSVMFLVYFLTGFYNAHAEYVYYSTKASKGFINSFFFLLLFETGCM